MRFQHSILVNQTLEFIKDAHAGQMYGDKPYWTHPKDVADLGVKIFKDKFTEEAYVVALLHDILEDTKYNRKDLLRMGYNTKIVDSVEILTKIYNLPYLENINIIIRSKNNVAMMVKYCDNHMNYHSDKSGWDKKRIKKANSKYEKSMKMLSKYLIIN